MIDNWPESFGAYPAEEGAVLARAATASRRAAGIGLATRQADAIALFLDAGVPEPATIRTNPTRIGEVRTDGGSRTTS